MKKLSLSVLMALAMSMAVSAQDYCTYNGNVNNGRYTSALTVTTPYDEIPMNGIQNSRSAVYVDRTETVITVNPGDAVSVKPTSGSSWMHNYLYVDYNNDKEFTVVLDDANHTLGEGSELVDFLFYDWGANNGSGWNAKGEAVANDVNGYSQPMSFTVPADLAVGDYRIRYKCDWNEVDPCGYHADGNNTLTGNGGLICDFTLRVTNETITPTPIIAFSADGAGSGVIEAFNVETEAMYASGQRVDAASELVLLATPNEGSNIAKAIMTMDGVETDLMSFVNQDGQLDYQFVMLGSRNFTITFGRESVLLTVRTIGEGAVTVTRDADGTIYASGERMPYKASLDIAIAPAEGWALTSITITEDGQSYDGFEQGWYKSTGGTIGWNADGDLVIDAVFEKLVDYTLTIEQPEHGAIAVMKGETALESGDLVTSTSKLTIVATPEEGYELVNYIVNGESTRVNTVTVEGDLTISALFDVRTDWGNRAVVIPVAGELGSFTHSQQGTTNTGRTEHYRVEIPDEILFEFGSSTGPSFTMSAWIKFNSFPESDENKHQFMGHRAHMYDTTNGSMNLCYNADGKLDLEAGAGNKAKGEIGTEALEADRWYFITLQYNADEQTFSVYTDGELNGTKLNGKAWSLFADTDKIHEECGNMFYLGGHATDITVDDYVMYNRVLTADEILTSMSKPEAIEGITAHYTFDNVISGTLGQFANQVDASGATDCSFRHIITDGDVNAWGLGAKSCDEAAPTFVDGIATVEYCTYEGNNTQGTGGDRCTTGLTFTTGSGAEFVLEGLQEQHASSPIYLDRTEFVVNVYPGEKVTVTPAGPGEWMHGYSYIDFGKDGVFSASVEADGSITPGSDLVAFNYYNDVNSEGISVDGHRLYTTPSSFTLPADLKAGDYRFRYKVDWNEIDPCGIHADGQNSLNGNGGMICDLTFRVANAPSRTVTVEVNDAELGHVEIEGAEGNTITTATAVKMTAVAAENAVFVNWTNAEGAVISTDEVLVYTDGVDASFKANFGYTVTLVEGDGQLVVRDADNATYANGAKVVAGVVLTVDPRAPAGLQLKTLVVNDADVTAEMVDGLYTFTITKNTTIEAEFGEPLYKFTTELDGEGTGDVYISFAEDGSTRDVEANGELPDADEVPDIYVVFVAGDNSEFQAVELDGEEYGADDLDKYDNRYVLAWGTGADVHVKATFSSTDAIELIGVDAANAEFFNLQGVRVAADTLEPGIYLMRTAEKTVKVYVK